MCWAHMWRSCTPTSSPSVESGGPASEHEAMLRKLEHLREPGGLDRDGYGRVLRFLCSTLTFCFQRREGVLRVLCKTNGTSISTAAKVRQTTLLSILRQPDAWRFTCKRIPRGQRADHALNRRVRSERCALQPTSLGEPKRWDGKNKGITLDDLHFLLDRKAY